MNGTSRRNRVLRNQISGNGYVRPAGPNFGIGLLAGGENLIEDNVVTANVTGMRILAASVGNVIRGNVIAGNPPIQLANSVPDDFGVDILNLSAPGANTFENNLCVTSMNAPCTISKPATVIPLASGVVFDAARVRSGGTFNATFSGSNLTSATYFDIRFRTPGGTSDQEASNWQQGPSGSHAVAPGTTLGDWTITGVRAHLAANDHSGPYGSVQITLSVFLSPF
jgi:hypothetical protein